MNERKMLMANAEPSCLVCRKLAKSIEDFGIPRGGFPVGNLRRYSDGSYIRPATEFERRDSIAAGAEGVIQVTVNGEWVACYVED